MAVEQLTTDEVARRLGVKPETVYAYVSRGLLPSVRNARRQGQPLRPRRRGEPGGPGPARHQRPDGIAVQTEITLIAEGRLSYRGHDVAGMAAAEPFESVVSLLWTGSPAPTPLTAPDEVLALAAAVTAPLPASARLTDRLRLIVAAAAAADPLRFDTSPGGRGRHRPHHAGDDGRRAAAAPVRPGRRPAAGASDARSGPTGPQAAAGASDPPTGWDAVPGRAADPLAHRLWRCLTPEPPTPAGLTALNAALVLLADHDLAASTLAARVAASIRAHPYAVVSAGLAALDGPFHGGASGLMYRMFAEADQTGDPLGVISDRLRRGEHIVGFGHVLYPDGDPRAAALIALLPPGPDGVRAGIDAMAGAMSRHRGQRPNIDFALAALARLTGMGPDAGETIFAVARTAGWIAHALEEYQDRPGRFRPTGRYGGPDRAG